MQQLQRVVRLIIGNSWQLLATSCMSISVQPEPRLLFCCSRCHFESVRVSAAVNLSILLLGNLYGGYEGKAMLLWCFADTLDLLVTEADVHTLQALSPHTAPLFVSAIRMLPAGLALICWAIWDKRPQPRGAKAWLWIAAFGFADATCFQVYFKTHSRMHLPWGVLQAASFAGLPG